MELAMVWLRRVARVRLARQWVTARLGIALGSVLACGTPGELSPFGSGQATVGADGGATEEPPTGSDTGAAAGGGGSAEGTTGVVEPNETSIVYSRCARTLDALEVSGSVVVNGESIEATATLNYLDVYDRLPSIRRYHGGFAAPCDLVLRAPDGSEEILYACEDTATEAETCAALNPAVSPDGRKIAFTVFRGSIAHPEQRPENRVLDPNADPGEASGFFTLPNPELTSADAQLHIIDLVSGERLALPHSPGVLDTAPSFLADGRLVFTSTRGGRAGGLVRFVDSDWTPVMPQRQPPQLFVMDPAGRDIRPLTAHGLNGEFYPYQLADGRIAHVAHQLLGMLPYRYTNGNPGAPGALSGTYQLFAVGSDGTLLTPLFGSHTHLGGAPIHTAAHRIAQTGDGRLWFTEAESSSGGGSLHAFSPRMDFVTGAGVGEAPSVADLFRPKDFFVGTTWASTDNRPSSSVPAPEVFVAGYADPLAYRGFVRDPDALPDGGLVVSWVKGACSYGAVLDPELFGDASLPVGSAAFMAANLLEALGRDTPGCDAGIYRTTVLPSEHPSDLELVVDRAEYHEIMPRAVVPYDTVHGVPHPANDPMPDADEPSAEIDTPQSPFGTLMISSLLDRETRSVSGHPFGSETAWARQGTDTGDYTDDAICGLRVLAVQPNVEDDVTDLRAPVGHRTLVIGEVVARKNDANGEALIDGSGAPDTSLHIAVPADVPFLLQAIDCEGRTLNTSQVPISVHPGETVRCHGCHRRSEPGLPLSQTAVGMGSVDATLLGDGSVPLLAGGSGTAVELVVDEAWGRSFEFTRDVLPIFADRCMPCHDSATADAGLVLDMGGQDSGSTWWRLVADAQQSFVPNERLAPAPAGGDLRKPQLSRYVRFMSARGSLLYWKAANARTDGRTDSDFTEDAGAGSVDVDFGPEHPTEISAEELRVLARWIDTGAGVGDPFLRDTTPPTLAVAVELGDAAVLAIGTVDVGSGIDAQSLSVCVHSAAGACELVSTPPASTAGTVTVDLPTQDVEREVEVEVHDLAGNVTLVRRTIGTLAGGDLATDAADSDPGAGTGGGLPTGGAGPGAGGDGDESGCRVGSGSPLSPAIWLLVVMPWRRRRGVRVRQEGCCSTTAAARLHRDTVSSRETAQSCWPEQMKIGRFSDRSVRRQRGDPTTARSSGRPRTCGQRRGTTTVDAGCCPADLCDVTTRSPD